MSEKASELLLQSAEPFDKACVIVKGLEEKLDWLIVNSASVHHSKDGDVCWVGWTNWDGDIFQTTPHDTPHDAIEAAMNNINVMQS